MTALKIDKNGYLDTNVNGISFLRVYSRNEAIQACKIYWNETRGSVFAKFNGRMYVCDGIDPSSGKPFCEEVEEELRKAFDYYEVLD